MAITLNGTTGITTPDVDSTDLTATGNFTSRGIDDNATSTAMTLDSSGNLLVGTTSTSGFQTSSSATGTIAYTGGAIASNVSGDAPLYLNRLTSDGAIATFRKDGTTVGSIGVRDGDNLYITGGTGSTKGIFLNDNTLGPAATTTGAGSDATTNLGASTIRFKDLYLSGGVYLGGTGAANHLDDYEEGTWTPTWQTGNGDLSGFSNSSQIGTYTKIGNTVRIFFQLSTSNAASITGTGGIVVLGLPFSADDQSNAGVPVMVKTHDSRFLNDPYGVAEIQANATRIKLFKTQAMNNANALTVADMTKTNAGNYNLISGTCVYKTSS